MAEVPAICAGCEGTFSAPDEMVGERMACPFCGVMMQIQAPTKALQKDVTQAEKRAAQKEPKEESAFLKSAGRSFRRFLRFVFKLAILGGIGYGGWIGYKEGSFLWLRPQAETAFYENNADATMHFAKLAKNGDEADRIRYRTLDTLSATSEDKRLGCFAVEDGRTFKKLTPVDRVRLFVVDSVWGVPDATPRSPTTCWVRFVMANSGKEPITITHANFVVQDNDGGGRFAGIRGVAAQALKPFVLEPGQAFWGGLMFEPVKTTPSDLLFMDDGYLVRSPINDCTPSGDFDEKNGLPGIKALEFFPLDKSFGELMFSAARAQAIISKKRWPPARVEHAPRAKPASNYKAF